jgi:hypothetical protein
VTHWKQIYNKCTVVVTQFTLSLHRVGHVIGISNAATALNVRKSYRRVIFYELLTRCHCVSDGPATGNLNVGVLS